MFSHVIKIFVSHALCVYLEHTEIIKIEAKYEYDLEVDSTDVLKS